MDEHASHTAAVQALKNRIDELSGPLSHALGQADSKSDSYSQALHLLMGELSMVALLFTTTDKEVAYEEREIINDLHQSVYENSSFLLTSDDPTTIYRELLSRYPKVKISLDHLPASILHLESYDRENNTNYSQQARDLFLQLVQLIAHADSRMDDIEDITIANFKAMLSPSEPPR